MVGARAAWSTRTPGARDQATTCFSFSMIEGIRTSLIVINIFILYCEMETTWFIFAWVLVRLIGFPFCPSTIEIVLQL
jgi:hypothetical protein